jgi:carbon-monoxide dehydrogenase large subunit
MSRDVPIATAEKVMNDTSASAAKHFLRVEDDALVRGLGRFIEDAPAAGQLYGAFVRSPHAHARIRAIDIAPARAAKGVVAVLTAADIKAAGVGNVSWHPPMTGKGGAKVVVPLRPPLAEDRVMHVGQTVALVVATTRALAQDAAELVTVEYEELPPVVAARAALAPGAPQLWPEAPGNLAFDWETPVSEGGANAREVERVIAAAAHVARVSQFNQRLMVATMEPRGATASYDPASDSYVLRVCSQSAINLRDSLVRVMGWPPARLRVITEDVGGAFGMKTPPYPEYPALLVAAKTTGKPVHWMATRSESFLSDNQARDSLHEGELALDDKGHFLALRIRSLVNLGAFVGSVAAHIVTNNYSRCFPGMYRIPLIDVNVRCVFTNTLPTAPYRGAGRPEANYILERLVEEAARVTGLARHTIRRRNLIPPSAIPYKTPLGTVFDSGDFPAVFDKALALSGYADIGKRKREAGKRGKRRGIGISCFLEHAGGIPTEGAALLFPGDNSLVVALGAQSTGQGHATIYPRIAAERLGIPAERVRLRQGDSDLKVGSGSTVGSRTTITAGSTLVRAVDAVLDKGRRIASDLLEAAESDIVYRDGAFSVTGTDRRIALFDLAERAKDLKARGAIAEDLDTNLTTDTPQTFPNGCHVAEVEIDGETGHVELVGYTAVDDCGNVLDHTLVEGQVQGGLAQGLGQALLETAVYDSGSGQLVTGSFTDYAMPRAEDMPAVTAVEQSVPATTNPLGVKGVGEAGTTGALAAIMNAIADAIPGDAGARMEMPATPEKVWAACRRS